MHHAGAPAVTGPHHARSHAISHSWSHHVRPHAVAVPVATTRTIPAAISTGPHQAAAHHARPHPIVVHHLRPHHPEPHRSTPAKVRVDLLDPQIEMIMMFRYLSITRLLL